MSIATTVFVVTHVHKLSPEELDTKFIGVFGTNIEAHAVVDGMNSLPGFDETTEGFRIREYRIGELDESVLTGMMQTAH